MAEANNQGVSAFPLPPMQYANMYTDENVKKGLGPKPPLPIKDAYSMFGVQFRADDQIIRPLENQGLHRLYPHNYDHKRELKKLNYSILVNFLDLLDILIKAPDSPKRCEKIDDLTLLFIHMHHLVNEFRPHQARETLRVMLDNQKRQRIDTIDRFQKHLTRVQEMVESSVGLLPDDSALDSKLLIAKINTTVESVSVSSKKGETLYRGVSIKKEVADENDVIHEDNVHVLDNMMCDIVDNIT